MSRYAYCWYCGKGWLSEVDSWKTVHPSAKVKSVGCPLGDGKSVGIAEHFPWPVGWAQTEYPKKTVFREIRPLNGKFYGMWNHVSRATTWTRVRGKFGGNRSQKSGRSGAYGSLTSQKQRLCDPFFRAIPETFKPIARFRWKRARLSFQASTLPAKFHPNPS